MTESDEIICNFAQERFQIFCQQNIKEGHFDVTFKFINNDDDLDADINDDDEDDEEKQLHAHSFVLWPLSKVFERTFFGPQAENPVIIQRHSYKDFKNFLVFLYIGECDIDEQNVMALVDLAEYYQIQSLKNICDEFLANCDIEIEDILTVYESMKLYNNSLQDGMKNITQKISMNIVEILKTDEFLLAKNETILDIVKMDDLKIKEEILFEAIVRWAEYVCSDNLNDETVKTKFAEILPFIRFPTMKMDFLLAFVVPRGYIFSSLNELSEVLRDAAEYAKNGKSPKKICSIYSNKERKGRRIQFRDSKGNKAFAYIQNSAAIKAIQIAALGNENGALTWNFDVPDMTKDRIDSNIFNSQFYVIREDYRFVLKDLKATQPFFRKDFDDPLWFFKTFEVVAPLTLGNPSFNFSDHNITVKIV